MRILNLKSTLGVYSVGLSRNECEYSRRGRFSLNYFDAFQHLNSQNLQSSAYPFP